MHTSTAGIKLKMNVLLFVTSLLMILSLMTYAKLDSFRYFLGMEAQFEKYMSTIERSYTNKSAENWYKTTKAPKASRKPPKPPKKKALNSSPRLSFKVFVDKKERDKNPGLLDNNTKWAKDLMRTLYGQQDFFIDAERQNPYFMDQILEQLSKAAQELPKDHKLKNAIDLSNLDLGPDLEKVFYLMLKGCTREDLTRKKPSREVQNQNLTINPDENESGEDEDDDEAANEALEYAGAVGYDSLLNYITLRNTTMIRVYLASPQVLLALVGDSNSVKSIIDTRNALFQSVSDDSMEADDATEQLKSMFQSFFGGADDKYLDFTVSKTNPAKYN